MESLGILILQSAVAFILGNYAGDKWRKWWKHYKEMKEVYENHLLEKSKCPHGHIDWDECPDCCH